MSIHVTSKVYCHEIDGHEPQIPVGKKPPFIEVESHWARADMIVLRVGDKSYSVLSKDLTAAAVNASNRGIL